MKKMTCRFSFFLIALLLFANCAATNHNYFLDSKPTGKNEARGIFGLSVGNYVDYDATDETNKPPKISIGKTIKMAPILSMQVPSN